MAEQSDTTKIDSSAPVASAERDYTAVFNKRLVRATYNIVDGEIVITEIKKHDTDWTVQTGDAFNDFEQWFIEQYGHEMRELVAS